MAPEGDRNVSGPYLFVASRIGQSNPFDHLAGEAGRAGITAEARAGVNALDLWEAGVRIALQTREVVQSCEAGPQLSFRASCEASSQNRPRWLRATYCTFLFKE